MSASLVQWIGGSRGIANVLMQLCAMTLVVTALVHSHLGERRIIRPLLLQRGGVLDRSLVRFLLRGVWHLMSILFCIIAAALWAEASSREAGLTVLLGATALGIGGFGIYDAIGSRWRHIGWPLLVLIGASAGLALAFRW
jgi:hypothetical protein